MFTVIRHVTFSVGSAYLKKPNQKVANRTVARTYADTPKKDTSHVVAQSTINNEHIRVRRARPADVPRVLRFIHEHTRAFWPGLTAPSNASQIVLGDYVSRALAQGHSMLAERQESKHNWSKIRALALGMTMCKWDATILEKWARCVTCPRSRQLLMFTAHCLRAPALHEKYQVNSILQVILIVPPDTPQRKEIIHALAKSAIQRGRDVGFTVLRFDASNDAVIQALEELHLNREWQILYDVLPDAIRERESGYFKTTDIRKSNEASTGRDSSGEQGHSLAVYTAFINDTLK
ncbi:unnamed protein product [Parnassius mnemosyne]|uniref:N-acetyltransferase domain-containing protein n=1 Tax=Parnassius mnemosyne TaxID=213953 RepID=A0AAV1K7Y3_9NEOP